MRIGDQEAVFTVWTNGEWRIWGAMDATYAKADDDYLATIPLSALDGVLLLGDEIKSITFKGG